MLLLWGLTCSVFLNVDCLPDFIKQMPTKKLEEYKALHEKKPDLTRTEFLDLCQQWAEEQGAKIKVIN